VLKAELTKPHVSQTIILTRTAGRASPVPERETLNLLTAHGATLCIFLSGAKLPEVVRELEGAYPPDTPVALVQKVTWPQQRIYEGQLGTMLKSIDEHEWQLSTLMIVGAALSHDAAEESSLYSADYAHRFRGKKRRQQR
jgi:precorrin-4/cobalt-precorrin-4 C11-methyltransferase